MGCLLFIGGAKQVAYDILDFASAPFPDSVLRENLWRFRPSTQQQQAGATGFGLYSAIMIGGPRGELNIAAKSFEEARNIGLNIIGEIDQSNRVVNVGRVGALRGQITGFKTRTGDAFKMFRIDYDEAKGAHINVTVGGRKYAIRFPGTLEDVRSLLPNNIQK